MLYRLFSPRIVILLCALSLIPGSAFSDYLTPFPPLSGYTHNPFYKDSDEGHGIITEARPFSVSSPVIAEIDGDPTDGKEVAIGSPDGTLMVYKADGSLLWSVQTPNSNCASASNRLFSSPAVGELFGDGVPYVVIGYGAIGTSCNGGVMALDGRDGSRRWTFDTRKFADKIKAHENFYGVFGTPALADVDGDGRLEVGFAALDRRVYLLNSDGNVRWYYTAGDTVFSSPAFYNVDDDPDLEMIIGTDISQNLRLSPVTKNGGYLYAIKTKKRSPKNIGFRVLDSDDGVVWYKATDQVLQSSPVIADVLSDNPGAEIIVGSGCFFPQTSLNKSGKWIKIYRPSDGVLLKTLNTTGCLSSSVAVGDLDDDGILEIAATVNGAKGIGGDGKSRISVWKATDSNPIWSVVPRSRGNNDAYGGTWQSPVIADLDGNGSLEVIAANASSVGVFAGTDGTPLTCQYDEDCNGHEYMMFGWGNFKSTPAVGDIDGDGDLDLVIGGTHSARKTKGVIYAWTDFEGRLGSEPGAQEPYSAPYPMWRGNAHRTGVYGE